MTTDTGRVRVLFDAVLDLEPGQRARRLSAEPDAAVRAEVMALLEADANPLEVMDANPDQLAGLAGVDSDQTLVRFIGRRIGPYSITDLLGYGGMGAVFLAVREDLGLKVALKLVRGELTDPTRRARFRREQAVLARLTHPNIAQLLDAGTAQDGTPWLAMTWVDGVPITDWCDRQQLPLRERLRLFVVLCRAVAFAHQRLVVHRDLKPSNVLVSTDGTVHLLDFGVAKLLEETTEDPLVTTTGRSLLSPAYASPEQVRGDPVTTATDVHGLGVTLYELLTGRRPFDEPGRRTVDVLESVLRDDPRRPSLLMSQRPPGVEDLDAICLRALAKAPDHRYRSAADLADDIGRFLANRPVEARLPTLGYRVTKFVRRNRVSVAMVSLVLTVLLSGIGTLAWRTAEARRTLAETERLSGFLMEVFRPGGPAETRSVTAPMKSFLDLALLYRNALAGQPTVEGRLLTVLAQAHVGLNDNVRAESLAIRALALFDGEGDRYRAERAAALMALGSARSERGDLTGATESLEQALALRQGTFGDDDDLTTESMLRLAQVSADAGDYPRAETLARDALARRLVDPWRRDEQVADAVTTLGVILAQTGTKDGEALRLLTIGLDIREGLYGQDGFRVDRSLTPLNQLLSSLGRGAEAEPLARRALARRTTLYGERDPRTVAALNDVGVAIYQQRRQDDARALFRNVRREYERAFEGEDHPMLAVAIRNIGATFMPANPDSAARYFAEALAMRQRMRGPEHQEVAALYHDVGDAHRARGALMDAAEALREAYRQRVKLQGASHPLSLRSGALLGNVFANMGRVTEADTLLRRVLTEQSRLLQHPHADLARTAGFLGRLLTDQRRWAEGWAYHAQALDMVRISMWDNHPVRREVVAGAIAHFMAQGDTASADRIRREEAGVVGASPR